MKVHLFGLARIASMKAFADLGVRSVDSASLLRRAWMGTGQNYLSMDGKFYTAIRIPEAGKSFRAKRMVSEGRASGDEGRTARGEVHGGDGALRRRARSASKRCSTRWRSTTISSRPTGRRPEQLLRETLEAQALASSAPATSAGVTESRS